MPSGTVPVADAEVAAPRRAVGPAAAGLSFRIEAGFVGAAFIAGFVGAAFIVTWKPP